MSDTVVVTGGCGFIGSHLCCELVECGIEVVIIDKQTYAAANHRSIFDGDSILYKTDITDTIEVHRILQKHRPLGVLHLAAESHVDRSINGPGEFIQTNVMGTYSMLEAVRAHLSHGARTNFRLLHCSTDEVFGDVELNDDRLITEESPYRPSSPYSASKAASDHLVRAWGRTYGIPYVMTHCTNNYGPGQDAEKLVPMTITNALAGKPITIHGDGKNTRDWLYVTDHVNGLLAALNRGRNGESYGFSSGTELSTFEIANELCWQLGAAEGKPPLHYQKLITLTADRPGNDRRYCVSHAKAQKELGWAAQVTFEGGIVKTVDSYIERLSC